MNKTMLVSLDQDEHKPSDILRFSILGILIGMQLGLFYSGYASFLSFGICGRTGNELGVFLSHNPCESIILDPSI